MVSVPTSERTLPGGHPHHGVSPSGGQGPGHGPDVQSFPGEGRVVRVEIEVNTCSLDPLPPPPPLPSLGWRHSSGGAGSELHLPLPRPAHPPDRRGSYGRLEDPPASRKYWDWSRPRSRSGPPRGCQAPSTPTPTYTATTTTSISPSYYYSYFYLCLPVHRRLRQEAGHPWRRGRHLEEMSEYLSPWYLPGGPPPPPPGVSAGGEARDSTARLVTGEMVEGDH